jgi:hypothetical protein
LTHAGGGAAGRDFALTLQAESDRRISARVKRDGTSGAGAVGVVAGFVDRDNYVAFVADDTHARLIRRTAGAETELASVTITPSTPPHREIILTLTCADGRITGHLDGEPIVDVDDAPVPAGKTGIVCDADLTATVREVVCSRPAWQRHHVFPSRALLPAGTVIELRSGSPTGPDADPNPPAAGVVRRYVAESPDPGAVQFGARAQFRLVSPLRDPEHRRSFLPSTVFEAVNAAVIRKRDATACFLVPLPLPQPQPDSAPVAQYRLRLTFRRDNRTQEPDSLVLQQAGDSRDEVAELLIRGT